MDLKLIEWAIKEWEKGLDRCERIGIGHADEDYPTERSYLPWNAETRKLYWAD